MVTIGVCVRDFESGLLGGYSVRESHDTGTNRECVGSTSGDAE